MKKHCALIGGAVVAILSYIQIDTDSTRNKDFAKGEMQEIVKVEERSAKLKMDTVASIENSTPKKSSPPSVR
jgi:hypothetical protein